MKKILLILFLSASCSPVDDDAPACYPVDDSCAVCGINSACFSDRVDQVLGCGQCALFRCTWPTLETIEFCSAECP